MSFLDEDQFLYFSAISELKKSMEREEIYREALIQLEIKSEKSEHLGFFNYRHYVNETAREALKAAENLK